MRRRDFIAAASGVLIPAALSHGQILSPILAGSSQFPKAGLIASYLFNQGSDPGVVTDLSGNGRDIIIPNDSFRPTRTARGMDFYLDLCETPALPITWNSSFTIMISAAYRYQGSVAQWSIGDPTGGYAVALGGQTISLNGAALPTLGPFSPTVYTPVFFTFDTVAKIVYAYRPDTNTTVSRAFGITGTKPLVFGIGKNETTLALGGPVQGESVSALHIWNRVLTAQEMDAVSKAEFAHLGLANIPSSITDEFDRADTPIGGIGISTSGWEWDYRVGLGTLDHTKGQIQNHRWISAPGNVIYAGGILSHPISAIGASISYVDGNNSVSPPGVFAMVIAKTNDWLASMIHMRSSRSSFDVSLWRAGFASYPLGSTALSLPKDGTTITCEAHISGNDLTVRFGPTTLTFNDPLISAVSGAYCYFEHYYGSNQAESLTRIERMWAA